MKIEEVMTRNIATVDRNTTIAQAAVQMKEMDTGWLPVMYDGKVAGVVTDRDIVLRGVASGADPMTTPIAQVMTMGIFSIKADRDVEDAAEIMSQKKVRRLLAVDAKGRPAGVVSVGDLASRDPESHAGCEVLAATSRGR